MATKKTGGSSRSPRRSSRPKRVSKTELKRKRRETLNALKKKANFRLDQEVAKAVGLGDSRFSSVCGTHTNLSKKSVEKMFELWGDLGLDFNVFLAQGTELAHKPGRVTTPVDLLQIQGLTMIVLRADSRRRFIVTGSIGVKKEKKAYAIDIPVTTKGWSMTVSAGAYKLRVTAPTKDSLRATFHKATTEVEQLLISFGKDSEAGTIWVRSAYLESQD